MATNKIASAIWFAAHGLPILPTLAIFHQNVGRPGPRLLRDVEELKAFVTNPDNYPMFGKPIDGTQSIGSASLAAYQSGFLITTSGRLITVEDFISYVKAHGMNGYQFQARISPHISVRQICGDRLATVRVLTIVKGGQAKIVRACWKIPAGPHAADNFWRPGNLLAQLDLDSGQVMRVIRRVGASYDEVTHHPDTGQGIVGSIVPNWDDVKKLALDAAILLDGIPLVGWDIAPTETGAVLVESNVTPDFQLHQLADRRGILDQDFKAFLKQRAQDAAGVRRSFRSLENQAKWEFLKRCAVELSRAIAFQSQRWRRRLWRVRYLADVQKGGST